ncbi:MAG TPA: germination protein YpeB [Ruminiclostridium sp.]
MEQNEYKDIDNHDDKLSKRRNHSWAVPIAIFAVMALIGVSTWGYYQNKMLKDLQIQTGNQYSRAFLDLADYVDNVEVLLAKSLVTSTPLSTSAMLEEVWRQANLAQTNMGQLPVSPPILEKTSNFLTQVGDLAYALNTKTLNGTPLSDKEYESVKQLHGYSLSLQKNLHGIQSQINAGKMTWGINGGAKLLSATKVKDPQVGQVENIDKNFQEYPSLIYDGPYSDHMLNSKPLGLNSEKVSVEKAKELVIKFLGDDKVQEVKQLETNAEANLKTYRFKVLYKNSTEDQSAEINITQQGGQISSMLRNRDFAKDTLTMEQAKKAGLAFLTQNGFKNMKDTYYEKADGTAVICYAYTQDDVIVYPDQVKVKVALDNGEIVGIESKGYLYNHIQREIPKAKITIEEARKKINQKLVITSQGKAIIPTDFKTEKYCYEFQGKIDSNNFLIYINCLTGAEEDILMLITTENGTLTM